MIRKSLVVLCGVILLSLLLTAIPLAAGCAPRPAVEEEKVVSYLDLADLTGPTAGMRGSADTLERYYFDDLNEKGGIEGVKVNFIVVDTRYDTARAVAAYKRYRDEPNLLYVATPGTDAARALAPRYERDDLVAYASADGYFQAHQGRVFLWGPCYQDMFAAVLRWVVDDWKAKGNPGMPKVGDIAWDNAYGREALRGGKEYAEKLGVTLLPLELFPPGTLKHDVYLTRLASAGANYIFVGGVDPTPSNVIRDASALGLTKDIQFISDVYGTSEGVGLKGHAEALEGTITVTYFLRGDEAYNHPFCEVWKKHSDVPLSELPDLLPLGVQWARGFEFGLRGALKDVGYEELDGDALMQAMMKLTGMDINEGYTGPCTYSETNRRGTETVKLYQAKNGKMVPITDWVEVPDAVSMYKEW